MSIKLKPSTSNSDQFYPLDDRSLSNGKREGANAGAGIKEVRSKLTSFSKNILKSTKNLAFDITNQYVPNAKEVKDSFKETVTSAQEDFNKNFGPLIQKAKQFLHSASGKEGSEGLKAKISKQAKEIKDRLKSGKFYTSMDEEIEASFGFGDDDFSFDDSDFNLNDNSNNSYTEVAEPDSLSEEPFGGIKKGKTRKVNITSKQKQLKQRSMPMKRQVKKPVGGTGNQLSLGDELVSNTTGLVGQNVIAKQEEIWARTNDAQEKRFSKLYGYQNQILKGINSLVDYNNNIDSQNVRAQMEFQGKMLAAQQDSLAELKELKDSIMVLSTYNAGRVKESLNAKISNSPVGLNGKAYWENIKKNLKDVAGSNPILSSLAMTPMMGDMLSMSEDTGMKMINPLNVATKSLFSMFLSKNTKNRLMDFNDLLSNFGGLFTGKMNMLARYGKGPARTLGRILGARESTVSVINNGLDDPNAVTGWTSKSDRTLNEVIPTLLAKQLAVISGKDELVYDYKDGKFKTSKAIKEEVNLRKKMAYENADTVRYTDAMASFISTNKNTADLNNSLGGSKNVSEYIKKIANNLIKTGQMWDPDLAGFNDQYRESLLDGIPNNVKDNALKAFSTAYNQMSAKETLRFNGAIRKVNMGLQQRLDSINNDYKTFGGASAVVESGLEEQIEEKKRSMKFDLSMQLSQKEIDDAKAGRPSAHYIQVQNERMRRNMEIRKLESTLNKGGVTAEVEGFGEVSGLGSSGGTVGGIPSAIDRIFRLLTVGVPVYNQGPILPDKLIKLRSKLGALDKAAAKNRQDEINSDKKFEEDMMTSRNKLYEDQVRFKRNQRVMQQNFMSYILPTGNSSWQQTNIINRGANKLIDASSGAFGKLIGSGYGHGEGLLGDISYAEIDRQNIQNAINAFTKQKEKLQKQIEESKDDPKAARKNKFKQKLVDLLDKQIEKNKQRLDAISNGKDNSEENAKVNDFNNAVSKLVDSFSNRFIMQTHEINPNDPSLKQQFGDVFAKGKEVIKESNIFLKVQSDIINAKNEVSDKVENIKDNYSSVRNDILGTASKVKEGTVSTVQNIQNATIKRANKIIETIKRYNITSAEEFRKISENNPVLKKYNFLVSKLFSTGAIKVQDGKPIITSRANTIIGIFVKRESEGKTSTIAVPTKDQLGLAIVGDTVPLKTKVEPKTTEKTEITKKTSGVNAKYSSNTSGVIVGEDGTVVDNSKDGSQKFKEYSGLKTTLALNGYENAYKLSNEDLYALSTSIKGPQGEAIRSTTDYRLLKRRTETKIKDKAKKDGDEKSKSNKKQKKIKDPTDPWFFYYPLMLKNGTLRYRKLLQLLQPKIGQSVYNFDKESLYAMITALPTRTGDDENFKAVLTRTKEFQHLKANFKMGLTDKIKNVFDVKRNFRRATSGIRLFRYRHLLRILDMMNLGEDDGFFRNKLDDKYALKAIIEGLGTSSDKKKQLVYNSIVMTKEYMKLARATVTGKSKKEIREKRKAIKQQWKAGNILQRKYGNLISVLRLSGARGNNFDYSKLSEVELYNLAKAFALRKDHNTGELLHASIFQMAEFKELQKKYENKKIDFSKLGTKTKEFFEEVTDSAAQSIGGAGTPQMSEVVNYLKVMAADSWKNLTGKIRSFTTAASNGFKNLAKEAENEDHKGSGGISKSIKYTARSVGNILSLLYATLISGKPEDINRAKLMNMQNIDVDNAEDAEVISVTAPERQYKTKVKLNTSIKLGGKIAKKYPKLTSALFEMGYADAPTMKVKDMYALIMATKGRKGIALRNVDEFEKLEQEASAPTIRGRIVSTAKAIGRKIQTGWKIAKLLAHKMLPYKSLVETVDQALNSDKTDAEKIDVFEMDKYSLYAAITTLPIRLRSIIMKSTPFSKLSRAVNAGKSWIRSTIEDKVKTVKKKIIRFKSFKYRYLIDFLRLQGYDGHDENHQDAALIKDPAELYLMLDAWGSLKKNRTRYNILKQSKSFKNLEKAVNRQNARKERGPLMPKVLRRTGNTIRNGISSLYSKFISGKSDDINRTALMNMQNIDMDDRPSIFGRMKQRISDFSDKIASSDSKFAGKLGLTKDSDIITTVTKVDKTKVKTAVDQSKNSMMANAGKRIFQKTKSIEAALLGTIAAGLTNLNKVQSSMAYFLGMNDKGEVDEKRKESLVGQLHDDLGNVKGGGDGNDGGGFWKNLLGNLGGDLIKKIGVKNLLKFGIGAAALTATGVGVYKTAKKTSKIAKEKGGQSAIGYATGLSPTDQDNSSWVNAERAGNAKTIVKEAAMGGGIKLVKETAKTGKDIVVTSKNSITKTLAVKAGKDAAKDAVKSIPQQISKIISKFLNSPKLIKKFGKTAIQTLKSLPEMVAKRFSTFLKGGIKGAKNAAKTTAKRVGKSVGQAVKGVPIIGWAIAIADAVWEASAGANDAGQYFNVLPRDVTTGMRVASGVANGVFSVIQSLLSITGVGTAIAIGLEIIVPKDWLVQTIYKLCANKVDEEELKKKQEEAKRKAEAFGTDAETLTKAENVSLFDKGINRVKSLFTKKSYKEYNEQTTAKNLNMSREEYLAKSTVYDLSNEYSQDNSGSFKDKYPLFATLTSPQAAQKAFNDPAKYKQAEAEALKMFKLKDMEAIYTVYKNIHDTKLKRQDTDTNNLTPGFKTKVSKMLDTLKTNGIGLSINEAKRDPFTQFAYFSKGRADNATADAILKMAGFGGLSFWGGDNSINTKTLNSNHLGGNAVDFNINNLTSPQFHATVDLAKKMGIEPGATWGATDGYNGWDKPHFQNKETGANPNATQLAAEGGIVGKLVGYAKDKTGQIQGKLSDFGSSLSAGAKMTVAKSKNYLEDFGDKIHMRLNEGEMVLNKGQQLGLWNKIKEFERNTVDKIKAKGSNTLNSLTHEEDTLKLIDQVFQIQNKIYNEQTRHNKIAEDFFGAILKAVMSLAVAGKPKGGYKEEISQMSQDLINGALANASGM